MNECPEPGLAVIDESGANPIMKKLILVSGNHYSGFFEGGFFIHFFRYKEEGPAADETGIGSTASSISWGNLEGWTVTGGIWCNSNPSNICGLFGYEDEATVDAVLLSDSYDIGDWTFHGTGFTDTGFIHRTATDGGLGNAMWYLSGTQVNEGTVPVLPVLGLGAVGVSVFAIGVASIRRREK